MPLLVPLPFRPKSDILKDPPSEANSIQSANATTKTSESNHASRYLRLECSAEGCSDDPVIVKDAHGL